MWYLDPVSLVLELVATDVAEQRAKPAIATHVLYCETVAGALLHKDVQPRVPRCLVHTANLAGSLSHFDFVH